MSEDEFSQDESEYAQQFLDALQKKEAEDKKRLKGLDAIVGYERGNEPMLVAECIQAKTKPYMVWYFGGYCLCSRFYKCRHQGSIEVVEGRERAVCTKYDNDHTQCSTGESV
jgi:hypothetical protein